MVEGRIMHIFISLVATSSYKKEKALEITYKCCKIESKYSRF